MPLVRKQGGRPVDPDSEADAAALTAGTADERRAAARALAGRPGGIPALGAALAGEADPRVREAILMSLVRAATAESVDAVLPYLRADEAALRIGALDALCAMSTAVQPRLGELLADPDADIRLLSCEIARALPAKEVTPLLCALLDRDAHPNVCAAAVDVLAELGETDSLPALARCAERFPDEAFLAFAIAVAAKRIAAPPSAP